MPSISVKSFVDQLLQQSDGVIESMNKTFIAPKIDMKMLLKSGEAKMLLLLLLVMVVHSSRSGGCIFLWHAKRMNN